LRFGEYLVYSIEGADTIDPQTPFPSMMLQPLLENATIHGIAADGNTVLNLRFEKLGDKLVCTLTDNGIGINAMQQRPTEHGRVSKGLQMLYKKVETINQLYGVNMTLHTFDLGDLKIAGGHGTQVVLAFEPLKVKNIRPDGVRRLVNRIFKIFKP
jgi:LytS/YehU family sensor histidine kinase